MGGSVEPDEGDRRRVEAFLADPASYGLADGTVERIDTHAAVVFLAGERAWKIKRPTVTSFLDFRRLEDRRRVCADEVVLNRRTAPDIYLGLFTVTEEGDGTLAFGGDGRVLEHGLVMRRFDQDLLLKRLLERGALELPMVDALVDAVIAFHAEAEVLGPPFGGWSGLAAIARDNQTDMQVHPDVFPPDRLAALVERTTAALAARRDLLDARREAGRVRRCHGDLHLGNIVLWEGRPTPFDCIEFSRQIAGIDVFYDLAFLLMDLDLRGARPLANRALARYLGRVPEASALAALPLMLSLRATVRAKVAAMTAALGGADADTERAAARRLFDAAAAYLDPPPPRLLAVGGPSGSGKSTLAAALAPGFGAAPGALHLRSDLIRKRLGGVPPEQRLPAEAYTQEMTDRVYAALLNEAEEALRAGHAVVVDAVFGRHAAAGALAELARKTGVPFAGLWLSAPLPVLQERVTARRGDASDATAEVVARQLGDLEVPAAWLPLAAGQDRSATAAKARAALEREGFLSA